jgi:hypothetical protein
MNIRDNLTLITSSNNTAIAEHNDLIIHLFNQLKLSNVPLFIDKWHIEYLEAKLPTLTPTSL